ncbi:cell wall transcription factor ACE2 [Diplogelasinospora grovesii]|uniref:Cell wall transcription factor ACE2 n=1 Tax=Diplogelasinospora grovesii TaxID=303347 RepID=A0AAN6NIB1_9PEZI|nr:cell wall transcription factor ACE2 [Diplogelasinospora grovesii]
MMSVAYETRNLIHDGGYPPIDDQPDPTVTEADRFADPTDNMANELATVAASFNATPLTTFVAAESRLELTAPPPPPPPAPEREDSPGRMPHRIKAQKPDREVTKNQNGKFVCTWPGCPEEIKEFSRKCEWNKHMDKHDRPYKCAAEGCEKLPGFTYSGGLLRHEREVHHKHGGPKNSFNCPHVNCKRHSGKGFSRMENLNEHLRRVHTPNGMANGAEGETDDNASDTANAAVAAAATGPHQGQKRKRGPEQESELLQELKRVRQENEELRRQVEAQNMQTVAMMHKINALQAALQGTPQVAIAAPAQMANAPMM